MFLTAVMIAACKPSVPSDVISPGDMEDILYDYHLAQAMARQPGADDDMTRIKYTEAVFRKYGITEAEFDSSLVYYYSHADYLKKIYTSVNDRLSDEAKSLGANVGEISKYSQYSTTGDTANIWKLATDVLLMPKPTMNRFDFTVKADSSFMRGDSFMFQFMSDYLWQEGSKETVVCIVSEYEGDSIIQTFNRVSVSGLAQIRVPANDKNRVKEMRGFIYIGDGGENSDVRKMLFVSQMQLIRFHNKNLKDDTELKTDSLQADSVKRGDNVAGATADTARSGNIRGGVGRPPLSPKLGTAQHGMVQGNFDPKK